MDFLCEEIMKCETTCAKCTRSKADNQADIDHSIRSYENTAVDCADLFISKQSSWKVRIEIVCLHTRTAHFLKPLLYE